MLIAMSISTKVQIPEIRLEKVHPTVKFAQQFLPAQLGEIHSFGQHIKNFDTDRLVFQTLKRQKDIRSKL